jgi:trk system potassium uptake protein TrkA
VKYIIIGLGNFGSTLATRLTSIGHEVFGVDNRLEIVEQYKNKITHTICLDSSKPGSLNSLPIQDADQVIVAIGEDVGASILTTALIKQHNAKSIISRAINPPHQTVFAKQLELSGVIESFDLCDSCSILEIEVPKRYLGRTSGNIDFFSTYGLKLIAIKKFESKKNLIGMISKYATVDMVLDPMHEFDESDILVMMGGMKDFQKMIGSDLT